MMSAPQSYYQEIGYGPNVEQIRAQASRVIRGKIPKQVRRELMGAVKNGFLGRLKKDGLKPEIFFHPDHRQGAIDRQKREAEFSVGCISKVMAGPISTFKFEDDELATPDDGWGE
jgi:hypothetical protein